MNEQPRPPRERERESKPPLESKSTSKSSPCHSEPLGEESISHAGKDTSAFTKPQYDKGLESKNFTESTGALDSKSPHSASRLESSLAAKSPHAPASHKLAWLYALILLLYCAGMVAFSRYSFNLDDIWMWLEIYHNKPIFNGYTPEFGRFFPLASLDLDLLMRLSPSPYIFFAFNALLVAGIGVMLWQILSALCGARYLWLRVVLLLGILLHPGFVTIMLGICYPERMQAVFLLLFVLASLRFYNGYALRHAWLGVVSANIALYYKEPTFLMIGCFGLLGVLVAYQRGLGRRALVYAGSLVASAGVYLILYLLLIFPKITGVYQRVEFESAREAWLAFARGMFNFALNDVFLLILLPAIALYRIYLIMRKKSKIHILWDSLLLSTLLYLGAFIKLKLFENYYLLPMYFMGFGAVVYFLWIEGYIKRLFFRALSVMCAIIFVVNTLPQGVYIYAWLKGEGLKFHSALEFIASKARGREELHLYFDGNGEDRKLHSRAYWIYTSEYLKELYHTHNVKVHFDLERARSGDLILLNQSSNKRVDSAYLADMERRYRLIYTSKYFTLPYIGLKPLLKTLFHSSKTLKDATYGQENYFRLPMRDYIYQVP